MSVLFGVKCENEQDPPKTEKANEHFYVIEPSNDLQAKYTTVIPPFLEGENPPVWSALQNHFLLFQIPFFAFFIDIFSCD